MTVGWDRFRPRPCRFDQTPPSVRSDPRVDPSDPAAAPAPSEAHAHRQGRRRRPGPHPACSPSPGCPHPPAWRTGPPNRPPWRPSASGDARAARRGSPRRQHRFRAVELAPGRRSDDILRARPELGDPAAVVYHGPEDEKVVALTFDDGWGGRTLRKILRVLREKHVNATFFPVGQAVRLDPQGWRRIAAAGFPIADHTFDHGPSKGCATWSSASSSSARDATLRTCST